MLDFDTIDLVDAQERITAWQKDQKEIKSNLPTGMGPFPALEIKAFTFHFKEMFELCLRMYNYNNPDQKININVEDINDNPLNAIRFYVGKKYPEDSNPFACLIAVPVHNFDPANSKGGEDLAVLPSAEAPSGSSIYDFSFPCPMTCANPGQSIMDQNSTYKTKTTAL